MGETCVAACHWTNRGPIVDQVTKLATVAIQTEELFFKQFYIAFNRAFHKDHFQNAFNPLGMAESCNKLMIPMLMRVVVPVNGN